MKAGDLSELAVRNLREAVLRNSLTTLGVAVGVASLVAMLSLGVGLQQLANQRLERSGLFNAIFVAPKSGLNDFGRRRNNEAPVTSDFRQLDEHARQDIATLSNVTEVYPQIRFATEARYGDKSFPTMVAGVPASASTDGAFDGMQGKFFSGASADEAILQIEFAKDLSKDPGSVIGNDLVLRYPERHALPPPGNPNPGQKSGAADNTLPDASAGGFTVILREKRLRVVGIISTEPEGGFGGMGRSRVFIPLDVAEKLRIAQASDLREMMRGQASQPSYGSLTVRVKSPREVESVEAAIKKMGFAAFSLLDTTRNLRLFFSVFDFLLGIFGSLALVVATLGIVNTLVMAILERRREIGILKALGAADRDVKQLFFAEAGVMGLLGGILGVGFGWLIGRALTFGTNVYLKRQELPTVEISAVPWWLVLAAIAFAIIVSLAAGIYPASRAAKLNPVEALRYE
ncbi:MAG TPA: FtsX-like permease family protein [Candidatus Acidoferrales bacterium]